MSKSLRDAILGELLEVALDKVEDESKAESKRAKRSTAKKRNSSTRTSGSRSGHTAFRVYGPLEIPRTKLRKDTVIDKEGLPDFWDSGEAKDAAKKQGCFILALRRGKSFTPWYVGKASRDLEKDCFTPKKISEYNTILDKHQGQPVLFLLAPDKNKRKAPAKELSDLERFLLQGAQAQNPKIPSAKKDLPDWSIHGVLRSKARTGKDEEALKTLLNL